VNSSVQVINMEDNDIGTEGAKAWPVLVSNCFHACNALQSLNFRAMFFCQM